MNRLLSILLRTGICVGALFHSGCATVTRGTKDSLVIETEPPGAQVRVNGQVATTPCSFKLSRKFEGSVYISKTGYETLTVHVTSHVVTAGGVGMAGNVLIGGLIGAGVDVATGAMNSLSPNPIKVNLVKLATLPAAVAPSTAGASRPQMPLPTPNLPNGEAGSSPEASGARTTPTNAVASSANTVTGATVTPSTDASSPPITINGRIKNRIQSPLSKVEVVAFKTSDADLKAGRYTVNSEYGYEGRGNPHARTNDAGEFTMVADRSFWNDTGKVVLKATGSNYWSFLQTGTGETLVIRADQIAANVPLQLGDTLFPMGR